MICWCFLRVLWYSWTFFDDFTWSSSGVFVLLPHISKEVPIVLLDSFAVGFSQ